MKEKISESGELVHLDWAIYITTRITVSFFKSYNFDSGRDSVMVEALASQKRFSTPAPLRKRLTYSSNDCSCTKLPALEVKDAVFWKVLCRGRRWYNKEPSMLRSFCGTSLKAALYMRPKTTYIQNKQMEDKCFSINLIGSPFPFTTVCCTGMWK